MNPYKKHLPPTREEQLRGLFGKNTHIFRWAHEVIGFIGPETEERPSPLQDLKYSDFITLSQTEILAEVRNIGLQNLVSHFGKEGEDTSIYESPEGKWIYSYTERGTPRIVAQEDTYSDIESKFVDLWIRSAKISLNHRYKNTHPELKLPCPSEM